MLELDSGLHEHELEANLTSVMFLVPGRLYCKPQRRLLKLVFATFYAIC
jgi:hypothetical protein